MESFATCGAAGTVTFEFGVKLVDGGRPLPEPGQPDTSAVDGLGDRAVLVKHTYSVELWAQKDGATYYVRNDTLTNPEAAVSDAETKTVMEQLMARATPGVVSALPAAEVGPACPAVDSPLVTGVAGDVVTARGGSTTNGDQCQYLGAGGTRVNLDVLRQAGAAKSFLYSADEKEIAMKGAQRAVVTPDTEPGTVILTWSTDPDTVWFADATTLTDYSDYQQKSGRATVAGVEQLGRAYAALHSS
jgi:hypothetical protein